MSAKRLLAAAAFATLLFAPHALGAWTWERLDYPGASTTYAYGIGNEGVVGYYAKDGGHGFLYDGSVWTDLDFPGAYTTSAFAVSHNRIVGSYSMPGWYNFEAGFLYDGHTWQTLAFPGAGQTVATGVSDNLVVGSYVGSDQHYHGFIYDGSHWQTLDYPGIWQVNTAITDIADNTIVGGYDPPYSGGAKGFVYDGATWTAVNPPGAYLSSLAGISGDNLECVLKPLTF